MGSKGGSKQNRFFGGVKKKTCVLTPTKFQRNFYISRACKSVSKLLKRVLSIHDFFSG